jgi:hypothetical protein
LAFTALTFAAWLVFVTVSVVVLEEQARAKSKRAQADRLSLSRSMVGGLQILLAGGENGASIAQRARRLEARAAVTPES